MHMHPASTAVQTNVIKFDRLRDRDTQKKQQKTSELLAKITKDDARYDREE